MSARCVSAASAEHQPTIWQEWTSSTLPTTRPGPMAIPARLGGKAVTVAQLLTLVAFLTDSPLLRPLAWATGAIALYAIWDYSQAAARAKRPVGE